MSKNDIGGPRRGFSFWDGESTAFQRQEHKRRLLLNELHRLKPEILKSLHRDVFPLWKSVWESSRDPVNDAWRDPQTPEEKAFQSALFDWAEQNNIVAAPICRDAVRQMVDWHDPDESHAYYAEWTTNGLTIKSRRGGAHPEDGWTSQRCGSLLPSGAPKLPDPPQWQVLHGESEACYRSRVENHIKTLKDMAISAGGHLEEPEEKPESFTELARAILGSSNVQLVQNKGKSALNRAGRRTADDVRRTIARQARACGLPSPAQMRTKR